MAGIDKTYYRTYQEYKEVRDWCFGFGTVQDKYGNRFNPLNFLYDWNLSEEEFEERKKEFIARNPGRTFYGILWNTPIYFDLWLIRTCHIPLITEALKDQYREGFIEMIKLGVSKYDTYQRNGLGKRARVTILKRPKQKYREKGWWIEIIGRREVDGEWTYDEDLKEWNAFNSMKSGYKSSAFEYRGYLCLRSLIRKIRAWNLPEEVEVLAWGSTDQCWRVKVRK